MWKKVLRFHSQNAADGSQNMEEDKWNYNQRPNFNNLDCLPQGVTLLDRRETEYLHHTTYNKRSLLLTAKTIKSSKLSQFHMENSLLLRTTE